MSPSIITTLGGIAMLPLALGELTLTVAPLPHVVMAALNVVAPAADGSLSACSVAEAQLLQCARQIEGPLDGLEQVLPCACCSARRPFSTAYDACASYIATSLTHLSSDYTLFTAMYDICGSAPAGFCRASSTTRPGSQPTGGFTDAADTPTLTNRPPRPTSTTKSRRRQLHRACYSIAETVVECVEATPELLEAPPRSMASCVCYSTGRGGSTTYIGEDVQDLASTCASWGRTALETDALVLATPFTTLCQAHASPQGTGLGPGTTPTPSFGSSGNNNEDEEDDNTATVTFFTSSTEYSVEATPTSTSTSGAIPGVNGASSVMAVAAMMMMVMMQM